jgi:hypothetical protein
MTHVAEPVWRDLEERIVAEIRIAIEALAAQDEPLAVIVLWADPYKGWYEVHADTVSRNARGARERNAAMLALLPELADAEDAWKTARTTAQQTRAMGFDPRYGDYAFADDPLHSFTIDVTAFVRSPRYAELNVGGEDGWLEGHMRFVLARAIARLVADGAFAGIPRGDVLRVGYAYPDSGDAIIVAHVESA